MFVSCPVFAGASPGQTQVDPYTEPGITIIDGGNVRTQSIVTEHMVANSIAGDRITADSLNANRIQANTTLSQTLIVAGGNTLATINTNAATGAQDPATRINANSTTINPGKILIAGGTTLDNWRDVTEIRGGAIKAYSVEAETLKISGQSENLVINSDFRPEGPEILHLGGGNIGFNPTLAVGNPTWGIPGSCAPTLNGSAGFPAGYYYDIAVYSVAPNGYLRPFDISILEIGTRFQFQSPAIAAKHRLMSFSLDAAGNYAGQINVHPQRRQCWCSGGKGPSRPAAPNTCRWCLSRKRDPRIYHYAAMVHGYGCASPTPFSPVSISASPRIPATSRNGPRVRTRSSTVGRSPPAPWMPAGSGPTRSRQTSSAPISHVITTVAQIANLVIGTANIEDLSVGTLKIANSAITGGSAPLTTLASVAHRACITTSRTGAHFAHNGRGA